MRGVRRLSRRRSTTICHGGRPRLLDRSLSRRYFIFFHAFSARERITRESSEISEFKIFISILENFRYLVASRAVRKHYLAHYARLKNQSFVLS